MVAARAAVRSPRPRAVQVWRSSVCRQVARPFAHGAIGDCRRATGAMPDCYNNAQTARGSARQR
eukprot:11167540-Lingulodinium_polyedra.AAC.1